MKSEFDIESIDLGAFGIRRELLLRQNATKISECLQKKEEVKIFNQGHHCMDLRFMELTHNNLFQADGIFIKEAARRSSKKVIQRQILFVHQ
jgi:hypothetical protein